MILRIDDWVFDIDVDRTMEYSSAEAKDHCTCAYCRNFYTAVDEYYPDLRPFLARFGIDIEAPDEQMPYDFQGRMYYDSVYMVYGRILQTGNEPIIIDDVVIRPFTEQIQNIESDANQHYSSPCFSVDVSTVILPWVLPEPMEETLSPANETSFLKKMWDRLLGRASKSRMNS